MTCETMRLPDGTTAIVCSRRRRRPRCSLLGCDRPGEFQCDAPVGKGRTCDRWVCRAHRKAIAPEVDLCPRHARAVQMELQL